MGPFSLTGQPNAMGGRETGGLANMLAAHLDIENPGHRELVADFWNAPNLASKPGLKAVDLFRAVADGKIKALWIMATNPVVSMPQAGAVEAAIKACPFVVVSDILEQTDTVRHAHVKLPSLGWGEKDGTVTNSERRISRQRAFLPPPGAARADWWQMAEVGKRMGWAQAFCWASQAEIFAEYAEMTGRNNNGTRDLDLSGLRDVGEDAYRDLPSFQWPQPGVFDPRRETRFFADGRFFTPDHKARFVPIAPHADVPSQGRFRLNTGRVRDHWHTMTRTGKAARLSAHMAEPYCELNPDDARKLGIEDATLVRLTGQGNTVILRALISAGQKSGSVFVPMHWNDQWASAARIDALVAATTDPVSGQPASKQSFISLAPAPMAAHGFLVSKNRPATDGLDYWALARASGGWRLEFALETAPEDCGHFLEAMIDASGDSLSACDTHRGFWRAASFDANCLQAAAFLSVGLPDVSRGWASEQLQVAFRTPQARWRVLAGRPAADRPEKGAIICACMSVGANEIATAVRAGCHSVDAVGRATQAGTNCGSCKPEITEIIHAHRLIAAE